MLFMVYSTPGSTITRPLRQGPNRERHRHRRPQRDPRPDHARRQRAPDDRRRRQPADRTRVAVAVRRPRRRHLSAGRSAASRSPPPPAGSSPFTGSASGRRTAATTSTASSTTTAKSRTVIDPLAPPKPLRRATRGQSNDRLPRPPTYAPQRRFGNNPLASGARSSFGKCLAEHPPLGNGVPPTLLLSPANQSRSRPASSRS